MSAEIFGALSASKVVSYYHEDHAARSSKSYYEKAGTPGEYIGKGCETLGLIGKPVEIETLARLAAGQSPDGVQFIEWRKAAAKEPAWVSDDAAWRKHLQRTFGVKFEVPASALPKKVYTPTKDSFNANDIPIRQLWRELGGPELRNRQNSTAFWRDGDARCISINEEKNVWRDFTKAKDDIGAGGGTIRLAATVLGVSDSETVKYLREHYGAGVALPPRPVVEKATHEEEFEAAAVRDQILLDMHSEAQKVYAAYLASPGGGGGRHYLETRGIKESSVETFGLGLSDNSGTQLVEHLKHYGPDMMRASGLFVEHEDGEFTDRFRDRLIFPVHDAAGQVVAFAGRKPPNQEFGAPYLNSPTTAIYKKGNVLYNAHRAADHIQKSGKAIVVEGYMDTIASWQAGRRNVTALSGVALSEPQVQWFSDTGTKQVILNLDDDKGGRDAVDRNRPLFLKAGIEAKVLHFPELDPDEWIRKHGPKAYREIIRGKSSETFMDSLILESEQRFTDDGDRKDWIAKQLLPSGPGLRAAVASDVDRYLGILPEAPKTDEEKKQTMEHRAAWDYTISAPKSVSTTALAGGDSRVATAHEDSAREAALYAERAIQVKMGGDYDPETTSRMVAVMYQHDTARPVKGYSAPQLHTHVVIFNMSQDGRGQWRALNPKELFKIQRTVDAVYQNALALRLKVLGYKLDYDEHQAIVIRGYTKEYLTAESPRSEVIKAEKEKRQQFGPAANQMIALATREAKLKKSPEEIRKDHIDRAAAYGSQPIAVVETARHSERTWCSPEFRSGVADDAVHFAKLRLSETTSVFESHEIHRDALLHGRGIIDIGDVTAAFERAREQYVPVEHWRQTAHDERWTTPELVHKELALLNFMVDGRGAVGAIAGGITQDEFRAKFKDHLNDGQKWLIWHLIHSTDRMVGVQGGAGVGKTRILSTLKEFVEDYGFEVRGLSATGGAVNEMRDVGLRSQTIYSFLENKDEKQHGPRAYFIDEASLLDVHAAGEFVKRPLPGDRVFIIGDKNQHSSLGAGHVFAQLMQAGMERFTLRKIERQRTNPDYLAIVKDLSHGLVPEAIGKLGAKGWITVVEGEQDRFDAIAGDYLNSQGKVLVVAPDNRSRIEITDAILKMREQSGSRAPSPFEGRMLRQRGDVKKIDATVAANYRPGDVVLYFHNSRGGQKFGEGLKAGDRASVISFDRDANTVRVMRESDGQVFEYNPARTATRAALYEPLLRSFSVGDRVVFTRKLVEEGKPLAHNGSLATVERIDGRGNVVVRMDKKDARVGFNLKDMPFLDHGYVMTSYSSQGTTSDKVIVHIDTDAPGVQQLLSKQLLYVTVSRGRYDCRMFVNSKDDLIRVLSRSTENPTALSRERTEQFRKIMAPEDNRKRPHAGIGIAS